MIHNYENKVHREIVKQNNKVRIKVTYMTSTFAILHHSKIEVDTFLKAETRYASTKVCIHRKAIQGNATSTQLV